MTKRRKAPKPLLGSTKKRVVILGLPPVDALDVIGPAEVFTLANQACDGEPTPYTLELVCQGSDVNLESETGIRLTAQSTFEQECCENKPIDTLIVAAGFRSIDQFDEKVISWIKARSRTIRRVCSICVGAFALAEAGLLDGRRATTHWRLAKLLADRYPNVQVDANPIWVKDDNFYTSAGISTGIDLALALVEEDLGTEIALAVAKDLVLFLRRPGGQAQFSVALQSQGVSGTSLDELCLWISEHLHTDLSVEILADRLSTTARTLIRMFQRELKTTPAKYVEDIRLEAVGRALELGGQSTEEIARRCGYHSVDVLRKAFLRRFGVSPREYALRFASDKELA
jgi:transcriptional regulator GlxA family with amidase domain